MGTTPDFRWVKAQQACSPFEVFKLLLEGCLQDVEDRNVMRGSAKHYAFRVSSQGQVFFVWREGDRISSSVKFEWNDAGITVRNNVNAVMLQARPVVNDDGECRLKLKDQELAFWQFRRRALDNLFFNF